MIQTNPIIWDEKQDEQLATLNGCKWVCNRVLNNIFHKFFFLQKKKKFCFSFVVVYGFWFCVNFFASFHIFFVLFCLFVVVWLVNKKNKVLFNHNFKWFLCSGLLGKWLHIYAGKNWFIFETTLATSTHPTSDSKRREEKKSIVDSQQTATGDDTENEIWLRK